MLADAAQLAYRYEKEQDVLWFRIALYGQPNKEAFGVNLAIDTGGDDSTKMNWWGANKTFRFDRLVTARVTRGDNGYQGTIGVGDAGGVKAKQLNNLRQNNLQIRVENDSIVIGVKRSDITDKFKLNLVASVGLNEQWNDDLPNAGSAAIDLAKPTPGVREIDTSRNNLTLPALYKTLPDNQRPSITRRGQGKQTLILVPGMYSGNNSFDSFITRNQSQYRLLVITPPGINGTPARAMPAAGTSFGEMTWTRRLERDILDLIRREKLIKPVILAERQPAAQAAIELASEHPAEIGGVVLLGTNLVQFFASPKDPGRRAAIAYSDRAAFVDQAWVAKWFKYVTPETWKNGDLRQQLLSVDPARAQTAWDELESRAVGNQDSLSVNSGLRMSRSFDKFRSRYWRWCAALTGRSSLPTRRTVSRSHRFWIRGRPWFRNTRCSKSSRFQMRECSSSTISHKRRTMQLTGLLTKWARR
jgi:pimeloyl-ACP methyl ester carboxylesterase